MNVDHFVRGKQELSQDYALSGMEPVPYAIIADGCSAAKYSDVGAMALAHAARNVLGRYSDKVIADYDAFGRAVIGQAENIANTLGRPKTILDATLGVVWIKDNRAVIRFYGDGVIFWVYKNSNEVIWTKISYDNNMPYYLRYWIDDSSKQIYKDQNIKCRTEHSLAKDFMLDFDTPIETWFNVDEISLIGIASDGLTALFDRSQDKLLELEQVLTEVTALRNRTGQFIVRRMRRMLDDFETQGIVQSDDISVAVISI